MSLTSNLTLPDQTMDSRDVDNCPPSKRSKVSSESDKNIAIPEKIPFPFGKDAHIQVLLTVEYHGSRYGGWQRQGPKNNIKFPSVQGTLEESATIACAKHGEKSLEMIPTTEQRETCALMSGSSGRTDRGVHALDHKCLLRLPFAKENIQQLAVFLLGGNKEEDKFTSKSSPFLDAINAILPPDIRVLDIRIVTREERKKMRFGRKKYTYLIQQANGQLNRPWPAWNNYTYFVKEKLSVPKMTQALQKMEGTHDFLPLSCQKGKPNTTRTLYKGTITVIQHPFEQIHWFQEAVRAKEKQSHTVCGSSIFDPPSYGSVHEAERNSRINQHMQLLDPKDYQIIQIDFEGSGFLRHQVRRMVSVLVKVGEGVWETDIVERILHEDKAFLQGRALAPGRALWKRKVWIDAQEACDTTVADGTALDEEDE